MIQIATDAAPAAGPLHPLASDADRASLLYRAAGQLLPALSRGEAIDARCLRTAMETAFGGSDAEGLWAWKDAYEASEAASVLFLRRYGPAMRARAAGRPAALLPMLAKVALLLPSQTRRSEESQALQQFSTPPEYGAITAAAAALTERDVVLEPSAGTGLLAIHAELAGSRLVLNELAGTRAGLLDCLFPAVGVTRHDAARIHDHLDAAVRPSVVLMNPPFSAGAHVDGRVADAALRHLLSALARLLPGGRLVAITGANLSPDAPTWRDAFARLGERYAASVVFHAALDGSAYARHGTRVDTRLFVIDRVPADRLAGVPAARGAARTPAELLDLVTRYVPPRAALEGLPAAPVGFPCPWTIRGPARPPAPAGAAIRAVLPQDAMELAYERLPSSGDVSGEAVRPVGDGLYEPYALQTIRIPGAVAHPTPLVQSAAMASVSPPQPGYRPLLPPVLVPSGLLSDAQLETVILAGEAHSGHLDGAWLVDETGDKVEAAPEDAEGAVRFRRGFFLGDGTGAGKGRQVAGVLLDNWLRGRRRALWVSKNDALLEDAQRDWAALGQERLLVQPLSRFRQGTPVRLEQGILFTTYATLRGQEREGRASRLQQILDWLGADFDGVVVFDEAHAMANAGGDASGRGDKAPSQQGRAGLRLQHALPDARVLYVSATGATTVQNLAYAQRLGLWGGADFPFGTRAEFVGAVEAGGVAAMEVLARDLRALGLYTARSLSYEGVQYELVEHQLTPEQVGIYDSYAQAFQVIHRHLDDALEASGVTGTGGDGGSRTLNAQAKSAARSAFESAKQRFFNHLITGMKCPTLIRAIERDLAEGHACVVQVVSTGEALLERRLADVPSAEWGDVQVDITPREYVLDYLAHSFPTQLHEEYTDGDGNLLSRPVFREGQPVACREAVEHRDRMIEQLAALPAVQGALDQIVQRFGTDLVAEVTGRSRRIVRRVGEDGEPRLAVETRPGSANLSETQAFQEDRKRVLVFSDAGGTGRSYHADLGAVNRRLRVHYLLEAGWKADAAIQGLGRTNRTNQAQPPLFRPVATSVRAEKRFLSTIARRLDTLGAITRGQRQTGGQGLFRADDNLESLYARAALRQLYAVLYRGRIEGCDLQRFEAATGLSLTDRDGSLREELPPITTFLNRLLALPIALQEVLFEAFDGLLRARIEGAIAAGTYDQGVETVTAESLRITARRTFYTHPGSGAETQVFTVARRDRTQPLGLEEALALAARPDAALLVNAKSGRAAVQVPAPSLMLDDGDVERRARLVRPLERSAMGLADLAASQWRPVEPNHFRVAWAAELAAVPTHQESTFHVVTGLLLPIWRRLPEDSCRVYRLTTDDGERVIGRLVPASWVADALGAEAAPAAVPAEDAWERVLREGAVLHLEDGLAVRRATVMGLPRVELQGFTSGMVDRLKAWGLVSEIHAWTLRLFVPTSAAGPGILCALLRHHPLRRIAEPARPARAAA